MLESPFSRFLLCKCVLFMKSGVSPPRMHRDHEPRTSVRLPKRLPSILPLPSDWERAGVRSPFLRVRFMEGPLSLSHMHRDHEPRTASDCQKDCGRFSLSHPMGEGRGEGSFSLIVFGSWRAYSQLTPPFS